MLFLASVFVGLELCEGDGTSGEVLGFGRVGETGEEGEEVGEEAAWGWGGRRYSDGFCGEGVDEKWKGKWKTHLFRRSAWRKHQKIRL